MTNPEEQPTPPPSPTETATGTGSPTVNPWPLAIDQTPGGEYTQPEYSPIPTPEFPLSLLPSNDVLPLPALTLENMLNKLLPLIQEELQNWSKELFPGLNDARANLNVVTASPDNAANLLPNVAEQSVVAKK